ncbi:MAG: site-specific integrase [Saprospiraceae bacterium]|nr:site-specific integrase [Saprospiraceae bacterium]
MALTFNLKRPNSQVPTSIYARYIYSGREVKYYLKESINPKFWDPKSQRARKTRDFPQHVELNALINKLTAELESISRNLRNDLGGRLPTAKELKKAFHDHLGTEQNSLEKDSAAKVVDYFDHFIHLSEEGMRSIQVKPATIQIYRKTLDHLQCFEKKMHHHYSFEEIDLEFYASFVGYLRNDRKQSVNTIGKQIKTIKTVLRHALEAKRHNNRDFESTGFKTLKEEAESIYLTVNELDKIEGLDLSHKQTFDKVRDAFLMGCYTGLRYSDYSKIKIEHIKNGFIEKGITKGGQKIIIPIHDVVNRILTKYHGFPPPLISNQRSNKYLKEICQLIPELNQEIEIKQQINGSATLVTLPKYLLIGTHTARRSFATNQYKAGIPSITIMAITGHKSEKVFLNYIKIKPDEHARIMKGLWTLGENAKL